MTIRIAVLGLGEAGSEIARDLVVAGAQVSGYDPRGVTVPGVATSVSEADGVADADLVLSANSSHDALPALVNALPQLRPGTVWADLNTAAPAVEHQLVQQADGMLVVDVALLSPVPVKGLRTPMLVSGDGAQQFADLLGGWAPTSPSNPGRPVKPSPANCCAACSTRAWPRLWSRRWERLRQRDAGRGCGTTSVQNSPPSTRPRSTACSTAPTGTRAAGPTR